MHVIYTYIYIYIIHMFVIDVRPIYHFSTWQSLDQSQETWGVDIVGLTSAMSALTMARRWRQSAFLFQGLHQRSLEATGMSYTVATGAQKTMDTLW